MEFEMKTPEVQADIQSVESSQAENKYEALASETSSPPLSVNTDKPKRKNAEKKKMNSTNAAENWRMILMARNQFTKHGRYGKPKVRKICVNCNTGEISWNGEYKGLNAKNLIGVTWGKEARPLQREAAYEVDAKLCFTLHFTSRDVCLQAVTTHQAETFVEALQACSENLKANKGSSKYRSKSSKNLQGTSQSADTAHHADNVTAGGAAATRTAKRADSAKDSAVMMDLPDRAMSKHMQKVRRQNSKVENKKQVLNQLG
jgi:hypothetical protein